MGDEKQWNLVNEKITVLARYHAELREDFSALSATVAKHDLIINAMSSTQKDVRELLEVFHSVKGGMTVLGWIGMVAKWLWPVAAVGIAISVYMKTGTWKLRE